MSKSRTLARERRVSEREHGKERVNFSVKEGRFQGEERGCPKRTSFKEVRASMSG